MLAAVMMILASSAYRINLASAEIPGRSLMYIMNNKGPSMLPWGTPYSIRFVGESAPPLFLQLNGF